MIKAIKINPKRSIQNYKDVEVNLKKLNKLYLNKISKFIYGKKFKERKKKKKLSIIYPIYGNYFKKSIVKSINSLRKQSVKDIEIIISEQYTNRRLYLEISKKLKTKYVSEKVRKVNGQFLFNPGRVRNMGRFVAKNFYLYFTDADILFEDEDFIKKVLTFFRPFSPFCRIRKDKQVNPKYLKYSFKILSKDQYYFNYRPPSKAHGGSIFITKDIFDFVGGYTEQFFIWGSEDSDLRWKLNNLFNLGDLAKNKNLNIKHIDHKRPYLDRTIWERNLFFEILRRQVPIENVILDDILSGESDYIKMIKKKVKCIL